MLFFSRKGMTLFLRIIALSPVLERIAVASFKFKISAMFQRSNELTYVNLEMWAKRVQHRVYKIHKTVSV